MIFSSKNGFTLVEILVVLIFMGLAGSLVFGRVGSSLSTREEKAFAGEMMRLCRNARRLAIEQGVPRSLSISGAHRTCRVQGGRTLAVPERVQIRGEGISRLDEDTFGISFYPDGSSDGGTVKIVVDDRTLCVFKVDLLTGLALMEDV